MSSQADLLNLSTRAANYVAKIFNVQEPADKADLRQAAALRMIETGIVDFDEARRGADAWRKRNADFSLSERDKEAGDERDATWLIEQLDGVHLSPTEWSVLQAVIGGKRSKAFAAISGMTERAIWTHRQPKPDTMETHSRTL